MTSRESFFIRADVWSLDAVIAPKKTWRRRLTDRRAAMDPFRVHVIHSRKPIRSPVHNIAKYASRLCLILQHELLPREAQQRLAGCVLPSGAWLLAAHLRMQTLLLCLNSSESLFSSFNLILEWYVPKLQNT
jgi:hypothetical protein